CETKASVTRSGSDLVVVATLLEGAPLPYAACQFATTGVFGALSAGDYSVRALIALPDGTTATLQQSISVEARGVRCNPDPFHNQVGVTLKSNDLLSFERRLDQDAAYRASLGNVAFASAGTRVQLAFPALQDPIRIMDLVKQSGDFVNIAGLGFGCFTTPPGSATVVTIEYRNTVTDRYFYTPDAAEQI